MNLLFGILASIFLDLVAAYPAFTSEQAPITGTAAFTFRNASLDDIDDITTVYIDAFSRGPVWSYIRQFADQVGLDYIRACQRQAFEDIYRNEGQSGVVVIKVISIPGKATEKEKVVSFAAWDMRLANSTAEASVLSTSTLWHETAAFWSSIYRSSASVDIDCKAHLDTNMTRAEDFQKRILEADEEYLWKPYGPQMILALLATHPDLDGNGFAARQLRWGKEKVAELNNASGTTAKRMPITLIGTPAGYPLYISQGFQGVHNISIERLDGQGSIWYEAMKYSNESF